MLDKLPPVLDPRALVSSNTVDDAGVYMIDDGTAVVFTTDFFTPVVDDPRDYGRIAAANALSDVYAMGGKPLIALNIVCFPDGDLPTSVMTEILLGGHEKVSEAGAVILGGHSVSDRELKYGLAIVGTIDPAMIVTNASASPGDALALTKPVGTGVLSTALKHERLEPGILDEMTTLMARLNRAASEAMLAAGASAATDVTGFGLAGHAIEMADAGGVTLEIDVGEVPLITGAAETLADGFAPGGLMTNQNYYDAYLSASDSVDREVLPLMFDPQTSGGLLVSLPPASVGPFEDALEDRGEKGWVIGRVRERGEDALLLV